jgi:hypothetical protein
MVSIHGSGQIYRSPDHRSQTPATVPATFLLPWRRADGAPSATKQPRRSLGRLAIKHLQPPTTLGRACFCALAISNPTASIPLARNRPSSQHILARRVSLGAAWPGAAAPFLCDRTPCTYFRIGNMLRGDCLRFKPLVRCLRRNPCGS